MSDVESRGGGARGEGYRACGSTVKDYLSSMTSAVPSPAATPTVCPACGATAFGRFCSECGGSLGRSRCAACEVELIDGARFCHRCGLPVGAAAPASERASASAFSLPWIVAAIALLALIALVAGQRFGANRLDASAVAGAVDSSAGALPSIRHRSRYNAPDRTPAMPWICRVD